MINPAAAEHEIAFWQAFVTTDRFLEGWVNPNIVTPELQSDVADFIAARPDAHVLDVGAGVVSILTGLVPTRQLMATDPLSDEFVKFFVYAAHGARRPVNVSAEDLPHFLLSCFPNSFPGFEIVHIRNAFDHVNDPGKAYESLWRCVARGGHLIIHGFANEANHENWVGFHQWNIDLQSRALVVDGRAGRILELPAADYCNKTVLPESGREWITWIKQKPSVPSALSVVKKCES